MPGFHRVGWIEMGSDDDEIEELSLIYKPDGGTNLFNLGTAPLGSLGLTSVSGGGMTLWSYDGELDGTVFNQFGCGMVGLFDFGDTAVLPGYLVDPGPGGTNNSGVLAQLINGIVGLAPPVSFAGENTTWSRAGGGGGPGVRFSDTEATTMATPPSDTIAYANDATGGLIPYTYFWVIHDPLGTGLASLYTFDGTLLDSEFSGFFTLASTFSVRLQHTNSAAFPALLGVGWWRDDVTYTPADFPRLYAEYTAA